MKRAIAGVLIPTPIGVKLNDNTYDAPGLFVHDVRTRRDEQTPTASFRPGIHERADMALDEFVARMRAITAQVMHVVHVTPNTTTTKERVSDEWLRDIGSAT